MLILLSKMRIHSCSDETVRVKTQSGTQDFGYGHIITQVSPFVLNISQQVNMIIMKITFIFLLARTYLKILYPYPACTRSLVYCTLQYTVNSYVEYCTVRILYSSSYSILMPSILVQYYAYYCKQIYIRNSKCLTF